MSYETSGDRLASILSIIFLALTFATPALFTVLTIAFYKKKINQKSYDSAFESLRSSKIMGLFLPTFDLIRTVITCFTLTFVYDFPGIQIPFLFYVSVYR